MQIGSRKLFPIMIDERALIERIIKEKVQAELDNNQIGISIENVLFQDIHPPLQVASSFEQVVSAKINKETFIEDALKYEKDIIPKARAEAASMLLEAEAWHPRRVFPKVG